MPGSHLVCVSLPDFPLQILHRDLQIPTDVPLVLVPAERPSARIEACNAAAEVHGVRPGMAYAQALSLSGDIRAGVVSQDRYDRAVTAIREILQSFSPAIESSELVPGTFWLDIRGVVHLFGGIGPWMRRLGAACTAQAWHVRACRGWTRAGTLCAALQENAPSVFPSAAAEYHWLRSQSLDILPLTPRDRDNLRHVAQTQIGRFLDTPVAALARRFSADTLRIREFLAGAGDAVPVQSPVGDERLWVTHRFEPPVISREPVRRAAARLLQDVVGRLNRQMAWLEVLVVEIAFENAEPLRERIRCGRATRDAEYLLRLLDLRFERVHLRQRFVTAVSLDGEVSRGEMRQEELPFGTMGPVSHGGTASGGDSPTVFAPVDAGRLDRAIATLQAELGADALVTATVVSGRFPEERFLLIPVRHGRSLSRSQSLSRSRSLSDEGGTPEGAPVVPRIRRIVAEFSTDRHAVTGSGSRPVAGPFIVSSAWWDGVREDRTYLYRRTSPGAVEWVYRCDGTLRLQGWLE